MNWNNSQILGCVQHNSVNKKKFEHLYTNTILRNCTENQDLDSPLVTSIWKTNPREFKRLLVNWTFPQGNDNFANMSTIKLWK